MSQFPFIVEPSTSTERRQLARRETDVEASVRRYSFIKPALWGAFSLVLAVGVWKWRYVAFEPLWLVRAHYADKSDLYLGTTNDMPNVELVQQARSYISQVSQVDASGNFVSPEPLAAHGVRISAKWFRLHHPDSVDVNPFSAAGQGLYSVTWRYFPGCQQTIRNSLKSRTDWYDRQGRPCYPACQITVFMDPSLKLTRIKVIPFLS